MERIEEHSDGEEREDLRSQVFEVYLYVAGLIGLLVLVGAIVIALLAVEFLEWG